MILLWTTPPPPQASLLHGAQLTVDTSNWDQRLLRYRGADSRPPMSIQPHNRTARTASARPANKSIPGATNVNMMECQSAPAHPGGRLSRRNTNPDVGVPVRGGMSMKPPSGTPKHTPKIQCEIIEKQLQHRRDCYARTLKEGALHSSHKGGSVTKLTKLLELFKGVLADEKETPGLLEPPQISQVYKQHAFGTNLRKSLGKVQLLICHVHPHSLPCS